jgi:hypothetical protein
MMCPPDTVWTGCSASSFIYQSPSTMPKVYRYVGPAVIASRVAGRPGGTRIDSATDLVRWCVATGQVPDRGGLIAVTFVIDAEGQLLVADRHSEHVACASGRPVLSAGEMFLSIAGERVEVAELSNQSTGYCPEPESWPAVAAALDWAGISHPERFTTEITFRRCEACGERNVVKDGWFVCGICGADLPAVWNF